MIDSAMIEGMDDLYVHYSRKGIVGKASLCDLSVQSPNVAEVHNGELEFFDPNVSLLESPRSVTCSEAATEASKSPGDYLLLHTKTW